MIEPNDKDREIAELALGAANGNPLSAKTIIAHYLAQIRFEHEKETGTFREKCISIIRESLRTATDEIEKLAKGIKISKA